MIAVGYINNFAILNKSYHKDLGWSLHLYRSWLKHAVASAPYFIVVPASDLAVFEDAFKMAMKQGQISELPTFYSEQEVLKIASVIAPAHFDGWRIQQLIKLCFSKLDAACNYLTIDSASIFSKAFNYRDFIDASGVLCTAARQSTKGELFSSFDAVDEKGWLHGRLTRLSSSLNSISEFIGNNSTITHNYIAGFGWFVSDLAKKLEALAISKGIDGFVGLLDIAPYEFAWYGEFVYTKYPHLFIPRDPVIMTFCHLESHARDFLDGRFEVGRDQWGILFQPPTTNIIAPEVAYEVLNGAKPMSEMKEIFENYALKNLWKDSESKSGPGSTLAATLNLREQLSVLVREQPAIRVFFDAPCGDFNWMRAVDFPSDLKYIGGEIAPALVDQNRSKYQSESRDFIEFDITESDFPVVADIWFCRDCLFHLPNVYILKALRNFYKSGIPRFMTSTHLNTGDFVNTDIPMAGFRLLDLYGEPFCFPRHVYFQVADYVFPYARREMSMWLREQVGEVISHLEKAIPGQ